MAAPVSKARVVKRPSVDNSMERQVSNSSGSSDVLSPKEPPVPKGGIVKKRPSLENAERVVAMERQVSNSSVLSESSDAFNDDIPPDLTKTPPVPEGAEGGNVQSPSVENSMESQVRELLRSQPSTPREVSSDMLSPKAPPVPQGKIVKRRPSVNKPNTMERQVSEGSEVLSPEGSSDDLPHVPPVQKGRIVRRLISPREPSIPKGGDTRRPSAEKSESSLAVPKEPPKSGAFKSPNGKLLRRPTIEKSDCSGDSAPEHSTPNSGVVRRASATEPSASSSHVPKEPSIPSGGVVRRPGVLRRRASEGSEPTRTTSIESGDLAGAPANALRKGIRKSSTIEGECKPPSLKRQVSAPAPASACNETGEEGFKRQISDPPPERFKRPSQISIPKAPTSSNDVVEVDSYKMGMRKLVYKKARSIREGRTHVSMRRNALVELFNDIRHSVRVCLAVRDFVILARQGVAGKKAPRTTEEVWSKLLGPEEDKSPLSVISEGSWNSSPLLNRTARREKKIQDAWSQLLGGMDPMSPVLPKAVMS